MSHHTPEDIDRLLAEVERLGQQLDIIVSVNESGQKARRQAEKRAEALAKENAKLRRDLGEVKRSAERMRVVCEAAATLYRTLIAWEPHLNRPRGTDEEGAEIARLLLEHEEARRNLHELTGKYLKNEGRWSS
jgi:hypothetical protein